jgi:hypothetical protein
VGWLAAAVPGAIARAGTVAQYAKKRAASADIRASGPC